MKARANTNARDMQSGADASRSEEHATVNTFEALLERKMQAAANANKRKPVADINEPSTNATSLEETNDNLNEENQEYNSERDGQDQDAFDEQSSQTLATQQPDTQTQYPDYEADSQIM